MTINRKRIEFATYKKGVLLQVVFWNNTLNFVEFVLTRSFTGSNSLDLNLQKNFGRHNHQLLFIYELLIIQLFDVMRSLD